jgi:MOSC domain-containing protein YiiM
MQAEILSVNVGLPRAASHSGGTVTTSIWKQPAERPIAVGKLNLEGDRQSDLKAHGGPNKAIYAYPHEHYSYWRQRLRLAESPRYGFFGENLTITGLLESDVYIGDQFSLGSARVTVTQPRIPCYKLGIRVGDPAFPSEFLESGRLGFYLRVEVEGHIYPESRLVLEDRPQELISIHDLWELTREHGPNDSRRLGIALGLPYLAEEWTRALRKRRRTLGYEE